MRAPPIGLGLGRLIWKQQRQVYRRKKYMRAYRRRRLVAVRLTLLPRATVATLSHGISYLLVDSFVSYYAVANVPVALALALAAASISSALALALALWVARALPVSQGTPHISPVPVSEQWRNYLQMRGGSFCKKGDFFRPRFGGSYASLTFIKLGQG